MFFYVSLVRSKAIAENPLMNFPKNCTNPRKLYTSLTILGGWPLLHSFYLIGIYLHSLTSNIMTQESSPAFGELTLVQLAIKLLLLKPSKHCLQ